MKLLFTTMLLFPLLAHADTPLTPSQTKAVRAIVRDEISKNPKLIIESLQNMQKEHAHKDQIQQTNKAKALKKELVFNAQDPSIGPSHADVTIIEFLDYQCGHCKHMAKTLEDTLRKDHKLRLVIKELPIFKGNSLLAAKAAIAASKQGKFSQMHHAIFNHKGPLNDKNLIAIAQKLGLDIHAFNQSRKSHEVAQAIEKNFTLAQALGIKGTPALIVTSTHGEAMTVLPGAIPGKLLSDIIQKTRQ